MSYVSTRKVLMLGWEFPPFHIGGLGVASKGLAEALVRRGSQVIFVLPHKVNINHPDIRFLFADVPKENNDSFHPYNASNQKRVSDLLKDTHFYGQVFDHILLFAIQAAELTAHEDFDIIHAHDWWTYSAGIMIREQSGKPLILHVHATSFDQAGRGHVNPHQYAMERKAYHAADSIIAVSQFTKDTIVEKYDVSEAKISVVHNAAQTHATDLEPIVGIEKLKAQGNKIVLYLGRFTIQKGPDYFIKAAKCVLDYYKNVYFIMNGTGDMRGQIITQAAELGISDRVIFTEGFGREASRLYNVADLYVMPSVSEPFGITSLEAQLAHTPVIISKQSGASEVIKYGLKVDFWDIEEMTNKIVAVLQNEPLSHFLSEEGFVEAIQHTWEKAAAKCESVYDDIINFFKRGPS